MRVCNELYHYGIPGMKWGVRRFQPNKGSGKKKRSLSKKSKAAKIRFRNETGSRSSKALRDYRKKDINKMSNKELQAAINRMNLEKQYRSLTKRDTMLGNKVAKDVLAYAGSAAALYALYKKYNIGGIITDAVLARKYPPKG